MGKIISVFQNDNIKNQTVGSAAFPVKQTILERYKALAASCGGEIPPERLYKFLSGENARIMSRTKADGSLDDATTEECQEFADFYINNVSQEMRRKMSSHAGGLPFFLREGVNALSAATPLPFPWNQPLELSNDQLLQVSSLMKFIESLENDVAVAFCIKNPGDEPPMIKSYALLKGRRGDNMKRHLILTSAAYMVQFGGRLMLWESQPEMKSILMCFYAKGGVLRPMSGEKLSQDYDKNPKGSNEEKANISFRTPDWP